MAEALSEGFELPPISPARYEGNVVSLDDRRDAAAWEAVAAADRAVAENRHADALALLDGLDAGRASAAGFRALLIRSWASLTLGRVDDALAFAQRAHEVAAAPGFTEVDRAEALYHLGCCRFKRAESAKATSLFTVALQICDESRLPCDRLRAHVLEWRSRCYQLQRDWQAARADAERALELACGIDDRPAAAHAYFQASIVAERTGDARLARFYAEEAEAIYRSTGDALMLARILNNLGGLLFLLGDEDGALARLDDALAAGREAGSDADVAQATSSIAQVHLRSGRAEAAEEHARAALAVLAGRVDFLDEIGNVQLVLGRALAARGQADEAGAVFAEAEESFRRLGSQSHLAAVWIAQGDLARETGDTGTGALLYRRAAESLQDFRF